eukprot:m.104771 g.104771  ORF g.104771 m.104771 type:complete len:488 (-) comp15665_c1_seq2:25-1488(-)
MPPRRSLRPTGWGPGPGPGVRGLSGGPCDILAAAGNPCVAAHSTARALYADYAGPLYTVFHNQSNRSEDIGVLTPGGFADAQQHEALCPYEGLCVITRVVDQSGNGNHLAPRDDTGVPHPGKHPPQFGHKHNPVDASKHKIHVGAGSTQVYGMYFDPGMGYKNNRTKGIATGDDPETMYAVMAGNRWGNGCCFDYGNSELGGFSDGAGSMEAIFFGVSRWRGNQGYAEPGCTLATPLATNRTNASICDGSSPATSKNCCGPWVGADLESGMYYGGGGWGNVNERNKPLRHDFVSLMLKGRHDGFMLKGGDASGELQTMYDGPRPDPNQTGSYTPMRKEGAIILGTGGDQSNGNRGNFYEGYMVTGVTTDATDDDVQANIAAVGYKSLPPLHCVQVGKSACYKDSPSARIMGDVVITSSGMTRELCMAACFGRHQRLAGVEDGRQCMCGNSTTAAVPSTNCTMACPGESSELCGGYKAINVLNFTCHF